MLFGVRTWGSAKKPTKKKKKNKKKNRGYVSVQTDRQEEPMKLADATLWQIIDLGFVVTPHAKGPLLWLSSENAHLRRHCVNVESWMQDRGKEECVCLSIYMCVCVWVLGRQFEKKKKKREREKRERERLGNPLFEHFVLCAPFVYWVPTLAGALQLFSQTGISIARLVVGSVWRLCICVCVRVCAI